uniref:Outer dynein arm-docking complex subunit 4 n=1 Tax=Neogobius melanostomus TaxID=47308 RepID=A0A8C6SEV2_9GOBI
MLPEDRSCYVGLSKCYLLMGNPEMALNEAENSLKGDKSYFEGLYQKAEALYYMGEFEFAKVCYHGGLKIRPEIQKFRVGIQKAQEAIENATGSPSSVKLKNKGDLSFFQKDDEVRESNGSGGIMRSTENETKRVFGEFYDDKKYLEDLLKDKGDFLFYIIYTNQKGESLHNIIKGSLNYIETCTEFRNNEKPIAVQKVGKSSHKVTRPKSSSTANLHLLFSAPPPELLCGNAKASLKKAEELMKTVQTWSPKDVPDKNECLEMLHRCIGNAHFELGDTDKALDHYRKDLELADKLHEDRSRALDRLGRVHAQMGQFEQAIEWWVNE